MFALLEISLTVVSEMWTVVERTVGLRPVVWPQALHTGSPKLFRRHKDVLVVEQLEHERPERLDCVY
ncbi:unnamed protein product [Oppiella nova]|uniref:Uncharacterized protein n=1 Tax=Oppiella nova TaxID=334625 RepID=A0A7R9MP93_9ACAR|nr:unnamed protein product [Oppiella nova]CAG2180853.1 unnamed protein product [Oppiella nova]